MSLPRTAVDLVPGDIDGLLAAAATHSDLARKVRGTKLQLTSVVEGSAAHWSGLASTAFRAAGGSEGCARQARPVRRAPLDHGRELQLGPSHLAGKVAVGGGCRQQSIDVTGNQVHGGPGQAHWVSPTVSRAATPSSPARYACVVAVSSSTKRTSVDRVAVRSLCRAL